MQVKDYVRKYANPETYAKMMAPPSSEDGKNGHKHEEDDGSELSQTSDIEPMDDDDMKMGSDEEQKEAE